MNTSIKHFMLLGSLFISVSLVAEETDEISRDSLTDLENNPVLEALKQSEKQKPENPESNVSNLKKENKINFPWLKEKSKLLQEGIKAAIEQGNPDELKKYQKGVLEKEFYQEENIEVDQLLECMALSIKVQKGPKKLMFLDEFVKYCKTQEIPAESYFDENDMNYVKSLALNEFNTRGHDLFKIAFGLNKVILNKLINQLNDKKRHYCNPSFKKAFKKECDLCSQYEKIMQEYSKK